MNTNTDIEAWAESVQPDPEGETPEAGPAEAGKTLPTWPVSAFCLVVTGLGAAHGAITSDYVLMGIGFVGVISSLRLVIMRR